MNDFRLTGESFLKEEFILVEDYENPNFSIIERMLLGEGPPLYVVRDYMDINKIKPLKNKFNEIIRETKGGNRNSDSFVKVHQIGSNQFSKSGSEFMTESINTKHQINELVTVLDNGKYSNDFILEVSLRDYFIRKGIHFGPSYHRGGYSNLFTIRSWKNQEGVNLSLAAHEDISQLSFAKKDNFEIHKVKYVVACNLCVDNDYLTELLVWNISPDEIIKRKINLSETGYPYPVSMLEEFECLRVITNPGDLYFINANYLHAVEKTIDEKRITLGRFMGFVDDNRVVYWT